MSNTVNETVEAMEQESVVLFKQPVKWKVITSCIISIVALFIAGFSYYQATRFNQHIMINNTNVGGLTAENALKKLESASLKNQIYIGKQKIYDGKDTNMGFTNQDLAKVKKLIKSQWTFLPSSKAINYSLMPSKGDQNRIQSMKKLLEQKLSLMNKKLKAPQDAKAQLINGQIMISKSNNGLQYDVPVLLQQFQKQEYNSEIHLTPAYIQPIKENSPIVKKEKSMLQVLIQQNVNYTVQNKVYQLKASDLIKNASVSKNFNYSIDQSNLKHQLTEINHSQSTLNKDFSFRTHSGAVISVEGQGYGWAIDTDKESQRILEAFEKGEKSLSAAHIYGNGWGYEPIGYQTTANNGIGGTYAEVSINEQRIWLYKNGRLALTTHVVTGRHDVHEDTHPGVWYILYKKSPSILKGSEYGQAHYSVKVQYWAPFTNDGQGFHDASWRKNWASNAYLHAGSGGCVNTPADVMQSVYDILIPKEPVIVY